jgi:predicted SnoaL-like aldol condensation-catalyzing enzyme
VRLPLGALLHSESYSPIVTEIRSRSRVSEGSFAGAATSFYDLFRVENGKIAEHWDTIEAIPDRSAWKNDNGKFGF